MPDDFDLRADESRGVGRASSPSVMRAEFRADVFRYDEIVIAGRVADQVHGGLSLMAGDG